MSLLPVYAYGGVMWYFTYLCEFCFLYCDDVLLRVICEVFKFLDFIYDAIYVDLKYDVLSFG